MSKGFDEGKARLLSERQISSDPPVSVHLRRSARARRYSLRVSSHDGRITLTLPNGAREADALAFAKEKLGWILQTKRNLPLGQQVQCGVLLPVGGREVLVAAADVRAPRVENSTLLVPRKPEPGRVIAAWMRLRARDFFAERAEVYAARLGRPVAGLSIRDTRSRWGSCTAHGRLMFNWRLMMAPSEIADYVAAHEVAHLVEMNHSRAFWETVGGLMPGYERHRNWLRQHGGSLQAWRFGAGP